MFVKNVYALEVVEAFKEKSLISVLAEGRYEVGKVGKTVTLNNIVSGTIRAYTGIDNFTWEDADAAQQVISLDQKSYYAVKFESEDEFITDFSIQEAYKADMATQFAEEVDTWAFEAVRDGAGDLLNLEGTTLTAANILTSLFVPLVTKFNTQKVPAGERKLIVTPEVDALLIQADILSKNEGIQSDNYSGTVMGIDVYWSNLLPANEITGTIQDMIAFTPRAFGYYTSLSEMDFVKIQDGFGYGLKGIEIYGGDVVTVLEDAVIKISFDEA